VFTGSRGEWGYLRPVLEILQMNNIKFDIIVTNMHVEDLYGNTKKEIVNDGFKISRELYMNITGNADLNWAKSLGLLLLQLPDVINSLKPDIALIAGDRAESFIFSVACFYMNIPSAHIQAGELSGHKDGMARHAIGKLTNIHFASNADAYNRLIRFGESKFRTFLTGAPQLDDILSIKYSHTRLREIQSRFRMPNLAYTICIFHPSSDDPNILRYIKEVYKYLSKVKMHQIWVMPNSDGGGKEIADLILSFNREIVTIVSNLNRSDFLHFLNFSKVLIGNSSSGILEAPCLGTPSINIGFRQKGRLAPKSVKTLKTFSVNNFSRALKWAETIPKVNYSLYGDGKSSSRIVDILLSIPIDDKLINKYIE